MTNQIDAHGSDLTEDEDFTYCHPDLEDFLNGKITLEEFKKKHGFEDIQPLPAT